MKLIYLLIVLYLLFGTELLAQTTGNIKIKYNIVFKGKLLGNKNHLPVTNAKIKLVCSDSSILETTSDSMGSFAFNKTITKQTEALLAIYPTYQIPYGNCPFNYKNQEMVFHEKIKLTLFPDSTKRPIIKDFFLSKGSIHYIRPSIIYFEKNKTEFSLNTKEYYNSDTTMDCLVDLMMANPTYFIEICGYSTKKEQNKQQLSELRAKKVYEILIKKGIDPNRLTYKGFADNVPTKILVELDVPTNKGNSKVEWHLIRK